VYTVVDSGANFNLMQRANFAGPSLRIHVMSSQVSCCVFTWTKGIDYMALESFMLAALEIQAMGRNLE